MSSDRYLQRWLDEERTAKICGWDFSHIHGRYEEEDALPWDYKAILLEHLSPDLRILDYDTGGGEFLLSLGHPHEKTAATEGYPPNIELCKERLLPLGIDFCACDDPANIPFPEESFDLILNRHGDFCAPELFRLLKKGGRFITQQVGSDNDRELVEMVLPGTEKPFPDFYLQKQLRDFEEAGFQIVRCGEACCPIRFYDVAAFVWFARIIEWEFPGFSVEKCYDRLMEMQKMIEKCGYIEGTTHRYLIVLEKPAC